MHLETHIWSWFHSFPGPARAEFVWKLGARGQKAKTSFLALAWRIFPNLHQTPSSASPEVPDIIKEVSEWAIMWGSVRPCRRGSAVQWLFVQGAETVKGMGTVLFIHQEKNVWQKHSRITNKLLFFCVIIIINTLIIEANSTSHYTRQSQVFLNEKLDLSKLGVGEECWNLKVSKDILQVRRTFLTKAWAFLPLSP